MDIVISLRDQEHRHLVIVINLPIVINLQSFVIVIDIVIGLQDRNRLQDQVMDIVISLQDQ